MAASALRRMRAALSAYAEIFDETAPPLPEPVQRLSSPPPYRLALRRELEPASAALALAAYEELFGSTPKTEPKTALLCPPVQIVCFERCTSPEGAYKTPLVNPYRKPMLLLSCASPHLASEWARELGLSEADVRHSRAA